MTDVHEDIATFTGRFATDLAAVLHGATVVVGDKLGLYRALSAQGPSTPEELAAATGCDPRYVREWLSAQAAAEYAHYDPVTGRFHLDDVQAACLADDSLPTFLAGGMAVASSLHRDEDAVREAFRTGHGVGWHEHHHDLFDGTERFFRPGYVANLTTSWIPAIGGLAEKLAAGATVADIGCGHGSSSILLGQAYPAATVHGFDTHERSIEVARKRAADAGVADRVRFEVAAGSGYRVPDGSYDVAFIFDALHDMGDPEAVAAHIRRSLAEDGVLVLVEPNAGDRLEDNLHLVGKIFYSASTFICTPASRSQSGEAAACLGAQAGDARLGAVCGAAGFRTFRRVAETPFNAVYEVRP
jgi:SAM-dependent methyltransferase